MAYCFIRPGAAVTTRPEAVSVIAVLTPLTTVLLLQTSILMWISSWGLPLKPMAM